MLRGVLSEFSLSLSVISLSLFPFFSLSLNFAYLCVYSCIYLAYPPARCSADAGHLLLLPRAPTTPPHPLPQHRTHVVAVLHLLPRNATYPNTMAAIAPGGAHTLKWGKKM